MADENTKAGLEKNPAMTERQSDKTIGIEVKTGFGGGLPHLELE
jgi:hypothetical protein